MSNYATPGVYVEENSVLAPSIVQVSTAIPVFLGFTAKGPLGKALRISSLKEYEENFGGGVEHEFTVTTAILNGVTVYSAVPPATGTPFFFFEAIRLYFMNGGGACYIISVGDNTAATSIDKTDFIGGTVSGVTKENHIKTIEKLDEPTLIVFPEASNLAIGDYGDVANAALTVAFNTKDKFVLIDPQDGADFTDANSGTLTSFRVAITQYLEFGAAYFPFLETTVKYQIKSSSIVAPIGSEAYNKSLTAINSVNGVIIPPSSLMAGVYARVDRENGVWKAPANLALQGVVKPVTAISDANQALLNVDADTGKSVNALREFSGKGTVVWGARTLDGNSNEWRYINVRRLFITVEESVKKATSQFVFENNDAKTWVKINSMITAYLNGLWKEGGLTGSAPEEAYFVEVGLGTTMTQDDILNGKMIVRIGLAAVRPAEFIILEFSHFINQ